MKKKIKNMLGKGGIADIVTLMIIVGLVIALIIAVVLPMITDTNKRMENNEGMQGQIDGYVKATVDAGLNNNVIDYEK